MPESDKNRIIRLETSHSELRHINDGASAPLEHFWSRCEKGMHVYLNPEAGGMGQQHVAVTSLSIH